MLQVYCVGLRFLIVPCKKKKKTLLLNSLLVWFAERWYFDFTVPKNQE
jgi:hypothetical protein